MNSSSTIFIQSVRQCLTYQAFCRRIVGLGEGADVSSGWISKGFCYCCLGYNFMEHMAQLNYSLNQLSPFTITYLFLVLPSSFGRLFLYIPPKFRITNYTQKCGHSGKFSQHLMRFLKCFLMSYRTLQGLTSVQCVRRVTFIAVMFWLKCKKEKRKVEELQMFRRY